MKDFFWALKFLTTIPAGKRWCERQPTVGKVVFWFPIIGLLIGFMLTFIYIPATRFFPHLVADAIILIIYIVVTGGFHLDGFADTCDGIFGGSTRERRLGIMRDSQIGSYGALCLICTVGLKYICLVSIDPKSIAGLSFISDYKTINDLNPVYLYACEKGKVLLFMCAIGRWSQILGAALSNYARDEGGTGKIIIENVKIRHALFSSFVPGILIFLFCGIKGIFIFFIVFIIVIFFVSYIKKKIGGMTGDTLGALNELSELTVLLSFLVI
ncbi:MAG: adenosylcobinamide-GDP ribazoletransferase [Candidatus Scalindua sp.]|jgi:adenosylcobinamide-GDP ribazoletransferase|nr:adenosylcobinamide-GDP ribazoletransferase [Candidatus Scalindua sp.]MBT5304811.1 adenosylcobinamide-GDP ribazoletransferase [Candidatus Scalindua sp.]MBT6562158.1 adenosylcobinamide-GDP ribazoletransferase [Candidatus Scalindua sp.]MBT7210677.1 adenosylcobinamide-GDP ribazoletransferase [Candidatus Scalindua sp.]